MATDRRLLLALKLGLFSCELPPTVAKEAEDVLLVYFPMWRTGRKNLSCWATCTSRYGWAQPVFGRRKQGQCHGVGASTDPPPTGQGMLQGSACSSLGAAPPRSEPHPAASFPLIQALRWLQGLDEHTGAPVQRWGGREEMAPSLVPELPSEEMPALVLGRGYGSPRSCSNQNRSPSKPGAPCHLGCSTCAHVPKHERMACAVEAAPRPRALPALPPRCEAHAMAGRW